MSSTHTLALSHLGIHVTDIDKMVDFYTRILGFVVSDRGTQTNGGQIVFMTRDASEHHQFVMATGRPADLSYNVINQMSFRVDSLQTLRELHAELKKEPVNILGPVTHGNAISVYFLDPEGNRVEFLVGTPWYIPQPARLPVDLDLPDDKLWTSIEERIRTMPGFKSHEAWHAEIQKKLADAKAGRVVH